MLPTVVDRSTLLLTAVYFSLFFTNEKSLIFLGRCTSLLQSRWYIAVMFMICIFEPNFNYPTRKLFAWLTVFLSDLCASKSCYVFGCTDSRQMQELSLSSLFYIALFSCLIPLILLFFQCYHWCFWLTLMALSPESYIWWLSRKNERDFAHVWADRGKDLHTKPKCLEAAICTKYVLSHSN